MKSVEIQTEELINCLESREVSFKEWKKVYGLYTVLKMHKLNQDGIRKLNAALIESNVRVDTFEETKAYVYLGCELVKDKDELMGRSYKREIINGLV